MTANAVTNDQAAPRPGSAFLTLPQAAAELGVSRRFLEKQVRAGLLRVTKPLLMITRISRKEWDRYIESCTPGSKAA